MTPEMILINGRVLTMDDGTPRAEALAVAAGKIAAVGSAAEIAVLAGPQTKIIDAGGRSVLPGSWKAICIWCWVGRSWRICNSTVKAALPRCRRRVAPMRRPTPTSRS